MRRYTINAIPQESSGYPISFYTASDYYVQETVKDRIMHFHQILLVLDGKGTLHCNGKSFVLKKGCAFYTASHTPAEYINDGGLISAFLTVKGPMADSLAENFSNDGLLFIENAKLEKYISLIKRLIYDYRNGYDQGRLSVQAYSFFVDFLSQRKTNMPKWLNEVVKYINLHFDKKLTLNELANHAYVSVSKLCHDFKKIYSMSVFEYIMNIRLQHAHAFLQDSPNIMTKDVAEQCGFFDVGYFCKAYRKKYGKTPSKEKRGN